MYLRSIKACYRA